MGNIIHARKVKGDELRFRMWSTGSGSYVSREMNEEELRKWTLQEAVLAAIEQHLDGINDRVERTVQNGTSSRMGDTRDMAASWDKELE